ncbi:MAG: sugar phosphate isomerase/epimerase [Dehalococcoidia bacterium]|nr:MAG: sugar phosphate isomerase/epimerase [Dehalococcoidia bacterium]
MPQVALSTMWGKDRFDDMAEFAAKAKEFGFSHVEVNVSVSPQRLGELVETSIPISSIHSPSPAVLSSKGVPVANLSLSSLEQNEREEAVSFAKKTIDLASEVGAKAIVLHMGEIPIDLGLDDELRRLYQHNRSQTQEYDQAKTGLACQRISKAPPYLETARKSLRELSEYSQAKGIMLGLETRFYFHEVPNIDEMEELLREVEGSLVGYWHDVGHAEVNQRLGFTPHEEWLSRFADKMIGIHLHDVLGISDHRPPGKGDVDWNMVAEYLPHEAIKVCEIAEWNEAEQIQGVTAFLQKQGIID